MKSFSDYSSPRNNVPLSREKYTIALPTEVRGWVMTEGADKVREILTAAMKGAIVPVTPTGIDEDTSVVITDLPEELVTWLNFKGDKYIKEEFKIFFEQQHKCWLGDDE